MMKHINEIIEEGAHKFLVNKKSNYNEPSSNDMTCNVITMLRAKSYPITAEETYNRSAVITFNIADVDKEELDDMLARALQITVWSEGKKLWHMSDISDLLIKEIGCLYRVQLDSDSDIEKFNA